MRRILTVVTLVSALLSPGGAHAAPAFRIVDLGNLGTGTRGMATSVNVFGDVVGESCDVEADVCRAFRWTRGTGMVDLGAAGSYASPLVVTTFRTVFGNVTLASGASRPFAWSARTGFVAIDVSLGGLATGVHAANDWGQLVGQATLAGTDAFHAFSWTPLHGIVDLGTLGGSTSSATSVSNLGHVVGYSMLADGATQRGFFWTTRTGMVDVGTLGGDSSEASDVNSRGVVVGSAATGSGAMHAFSWTQRGGMVDLGTIGGDFSDASLINERGQIVGGSGGGGTFFWSAETGMIDIGSLGGGATSPIAVNEAGQVVGISRLPDATRPHAFSWTRAGGMVDLGTLPGGDTSIATAVSPTGLVVGASNTGVPGETRAVLWVPTHGER